MKKLNEVAKYRRRGCLIDKLKMQSVSLTDESFAALTAMFPNAVTETIDDNGVVAWATNRDEPVEYLLSQVVPDPRILVSYEQIFRTYSPTVRRRML